MSNKNPKYYDITYLLFFGIVFVVLLGTSYFNIINFNAFALTDKFTLPDSNIKISIDRPSNWEKTKTLPDVLKDDTTTEDNFIVMYGSPETDDDDNYLAEIRFFKYPLNDSNQDIYSLMQDDINVTQSSNLERGFGFNLLNSSADFSLDGYPGYIYTFTTTDQNNIPRLVGISAVVVNSNLYEIVGATDVDKQDQYLPTLNHIMQSFKIDDPSTPSPNAFDQYSNYNVNDNFTFPESGTSISIERPYNWIKNDTLPAWLKNSEISNENFIVMYNPPEINDKGYYASEIRFFKFPLYQDSQDINILMQNDIEASRGINNNFQLVSSNPNFSLDGYSGFTYTFTSNTDYGKTVTVSVAAIVVNSNLYDIQYVTDKDKQDQYMPILNKIIQSFKITNNLNPFGYNIDQNSSSQNAFFASCENSRSNQNQGTDSPDALGSFTYKNSFYGFKFSHSKSWNAVECSDHIQIVPSLSTSLSSNVANVGKPVVKLSIGLLNLKPDENPFTSYIDYLNSTNGQTLQLLEFKPFAYKGLPSYRITSIYYDYDEGLWKKEMSIFAPSDNLLYLFKYNANANLYSKYLPAITKILNSIIFTSNQPSSETSPINPSIIPPSITGGA